MDGLEEKECDAYFRRLQTASQSRMFPSSSFPIECVFSGCQWATRSRPFSLGSLRGSIRTCPLSSYTTSSPGWLRCSIYASGGDENGGPDADGAFEVGNSRHMRFPRGEGASSCVIRSAHAGRREGFKAQKNYIIPIDLRDSFRQSFFILLFSKKDSEQHRYRENSLQYNHRSNQTDPIPPQNLSTIHP